MTKRRHKRFSITGIATVQFEDEGTIKTTQGILCSISSVGMGLHIDKPIEANKQVSIAISFVSIGGVENTVIEGSVVYNKELGKSHFVGIKFNEAVSSENQPLLYVHIQNILSFDK
jgi:hypothetical protein